MDASVSAAADYDARLAAAGFPYWHGWKGVAGLLYARRPRTSPPQVVRAVTWDGLVGEIREKENEIREKNQQNGHRQLVRLHRPHALPPSAVMALALGG